MTSRKFRSHRNGRQGFTLVEMLAAVTVTVMLLGIIAAATQGTSMAVHQASSKMSTYAAARAGFNTMIAKLSQATLNTYLDYYGTPLNGTQYAIRTLTNEATFIPVYFGRCSDLQFVIQQNVDITEPGLGQEVYFQCPVAYSQSSPFSYQGIQGLLNSCGFYVEYNSNSAYEPSLITASTNGSVKWRYRLMQSIEPTESLGIYKNAASSDSFSTGTWGGGIMDPGLGGTLKDQFNSLMLPMADNVIALVIWPRQPLDQDSTGQNLSTNYQYDSQKNTGTFTGTPATQPLTANQLPPLLQVTMVVIDEASAMRLDTHGAAPPAVIKAALVASKFNVNTVAQYTLDLSNLEAALAKAHINFEVFNSTVMMRESKWSQ